MDEVQDVQWEDHWPSKRRCLLTCIATTCLPATLRTRSSVTIKVVSWRDIYNTGPYIHPRGQNQFDVYITPDFTMSILLNFIEWHFFLELRKQAVVFSAGRWDIVSWSHGGQGLPIGQQDILVTNLLNRAGGTSNVIEIVGSLSRPSGCLCWMDKDLPPPKPRTITAFEAQRMRAGKTPSFKAIAVTQAPGAPGTMNTALPAPPPSSRQPAKAARQSQPETTYMYDIPVDPPSYEDALLIEGNTVTDTNTQDDSLLSHSSNLSYSTSDNSSDDSSESS